MAQSRNLKTMNKVTKRLMQLFHKSAKHFGVDSWQTNLFLTELRYTNSLAARHVIINQHLYD